MRLRTNIIIQINLLIILGTNFGIKFTRQPGSTIFAGKLMLNQRWISRYFSLSHQLLCEMSSTGGSTLCVMENHHPSLWRVMQHQIKILFQDLCLEYGLALVLLSCTSLVALTHCIFLLHQGKRRLGSKGRNWFLPYAAFL